MPRWWIQAADQGEEPAIKCLRIVLDLRLFPPGTAVKLVAMKAAILNGKARQAWLGGGSS